MKKLMRFWCKLFGHNWYYSLNNPYSNYRFCDQCKTLKHKNEIPNLPDHMKE